MQIHAKLETKIKEWLKPRLTHDYQKWKTRIRIKDILWGSYLDKFYSINLYYIQFPLVIFARICKNLFVVGHQYVNELALLWQPWKIIFLIHNLAVLCMKSELCTVGSYCMPRGPVFCICKSVNSPSWWNSVGGKENPEIETKYSYTSSSIGR